MKKNEKKFGKVKKSLYLCIGLGTIAQLNIFHKQFFKMANFLCVKYADLVTNGKKVWFMGRSNCMDLAAQCVPSHVISDLTLFGRSAHDQVHIIENDGSIETRKVLTTTEWQTSVGFARIKNNIQRKIRTRKYTSEGVLISEKITLE